MFFTGSSKPCRKVLTAVLMVGFERLTRSARVSMTGSMMLLKSAVTLLVACVFKAELMADSTLLFTVLASCAN